MNDDVQWLEEYARTGSPQAFARLVETHLGLVYSAALRQLKDHHLAEDVTQQAFIKLAQKAPSLKRETVPAAWLLVTTRYLARDAKRAAARRAARERKVAEMRSTVPASPDHDPWSDIEPLLDEAMCSLSADDQRAVTLRYLQGRNVEQVAAALDVSRDAAAQRLHRAIGRLRDYLQRRGAVVDQAALGSLMLSRALQQPPPALAASVVKSAAALHTGAGIFSKGAAMAAVSTKVKLITTAAILALTLGGTATVIYKVTQEPQTRVLAINPDAAPSAAPAAAAIPVAGEEAWRTRFNEVYSLAPAEVLKRIPTPYILERNAYFTSITRAGGGMPVPSLGGISVAAALFNFDQQPQASMLLFYRQFDFLGLAQALAGLRSLDFDRLGSLRSLSLPGDWVWRRGTAGPVVMEALQEILAKDFGRQIRFVRRTVDRDVIVATGTIQLHKLPKEMNDTVAIYVGKRTGDGLSVSGGSTSEFVSELGETLGVKAISDAAPIDKQFSWKLYVKPEQMRQPGAREELLKNISEQTGIVFTMERRRVEIWFVESPPGITPPTAPDQK